eukprot:CAMPEP_0201926362 /NCGR_PEP_ID=MMETSP0903-20130614/16028_1 /ASSEMBLY_ACC=CAM_ASM_000552 /TAXON_ID=420261 /ORGANISM="Thalassiosira antarctica, Strain CCMP982" /LENGTH=208 /DNA_ID=CAMNT_0048464229 /DNA_START=93 /DNA_END=716 /DNA_ORIENTATION=-
MNELNHPFSMIEYASGTMAALVDTAHGHSDGDVSVSSYPPIIRRRRTLKDRIKRSMASSPTPSATSAASPSFSVTRSPITGGGSVSGNGNDPREELVLAAASALASLNSRGAVSVSGGDERRKEEHPTNNATWGASSVVRNAHEGSTLLSGRMLMPSLIRPPLIVAPPSVAVAAATAPPSQLEILGTESRLSRPFASLLGSDIPLTFP